MNKNKIFYLKILILIICISIIVFTIYNTKIKSTKTEVYNNSNLGISLNFPEDWNGKYKVEERNDSIYVYYVSTSTSKKGLIFTIVKLNSNGQAVDGEMYDSIGTKNILDINGSKYKVGGSTDIGFPEDDSDSKTYKKMKSQTSKRIDTVKTSK